MNFNIKEFNIDSIGSSEKKTNLLPSIPKSSGAPPTLDLSTDDLFGLDSIMNKSKAKKSPSPTSMSSPPAAKSPISFSSAPSFTPSKPSSPSGLSNITKLDVGSSSPELKSVGGSLFSKPSTPPSTSKIPGLSMPPPSFASASNTIPDLDKEIKSLEKGLNDDMAKVNQMKSGMNSPQLPNFGSTPPNNATNAPFTPVNSDPNSIMNLSYEEIQKRKLKLLCDFDKLRSKGVKVMKQYNMSSDYEEMKNEYDILISNKRINDSIKWQRRFFVTLASGLETFTRSSYNPLDFELTNFGSEVSDDIESYDDIFEELHLKYVGEGGNYPPELRLVFKMGTTAAWCMYQQKIMANSNVPDFNRIMKDNPQLNQQFKQASMNAYQKMNTGEAASMGKFMSGMMGNQQTDGPPLYDGGAPSSSSNDAVPNLDDILNSL
jgi:hypothetical protein